MEWEHDSSVWLDFRYREDQIMLGQIDDRARVHGVDVGDLHDLLVGGGQLDLLLECIRTKGL